MQDLEQQLIMYFYDALDAEQAKQLESKLAEDEQLADMYQRLKTELQAAQDLTPEPDQQFEQRVWQAVEPQLPQANQASMLDTAASTGLWHKFVHFLSQVFAPVQRPAVVFSLVALLVTGSFFFGRYQLTQDIDQHPEQFVASLSEQARENILLHSVADHLERSSRLLTNVAVTNDEQSLLDEQRWAKKLLTSNRLFRSAAEAAEQWRIVAILDELEPILIEMSTAPDNDLASRENIRSRIKDNSLVFKTRTFDPLMDKSI